VSYEARLKESWVWKELHAVRNVKPGKGSDTHKLEIDGGMTDGVLFRVCYATKRTVVRRSGFLFFGGSIFSDRTTNIVLVIVKGNKEKSPKGL
jgi:hypothetical protein